MQGEVVVRPVPDATLGRCRGWSAYYSQPRPRGSVTLVVAGVCEFPTPGYEVALRHKDPQGINDRILALERVVRPPIGPQPQVVSTVRVAYREPLPGRQHEAVSIQPDGPQLSLRSVRRA